MDEITITKKDMHKGGEFVILGGGKTSVTLVPIERKGDRRLWGTKAQKARLEKYPDASDFYWYKRDTGWCLTWRGDSCKT